MHWIASSILLGWVHQKCKLIFQLHQVKENLIWVVCYTTKKCILESGTNNLSVHVVLTACTLLFFGTRNLELVHEFTYPHLLLCLQSQSVYLLAHVLICIWVLNFEVRPLGFSFLFPPEMLKYIRCKNTYTYNFNLSWFFMVVPLLSWINFE
jgi:hypothetical protein